MGEKIHVLSAVFGSEYNGFITGADKVIRKSGEVGVAVGRALAAVDNMLTRLAAAATATAAIVGGTVAKMGGDFLVLEENAKTSFTTLLGSAEAAKEMWLELKQIARTSPFQLDNITDAARRLLGMGYAGKEIPRVLRAIGDAIAAMGGGQEMIQRVSIALGQIRAKGVVAAEEMLQLAENGIPAWQMLADAIGTDIPTAMKLVEQRAVSSEIAIEALLRGIEQRFGGMSIKMASNWTGLWAAFIDTAKEQSGEVMKPLFNAAKRWLQQVTDYLSGPAFRGFVGDITIRIQSMVDEVNRLLSDMGRGNAAQNAQSMLLSLLDVIRDAIGWIRDNRGAIEEWGTALGSWLKPIGQLIAAYPQLVMFFALFKVAQLFGITTAVYEVGRAIGVTAGALYKLTQPAENASSSIKKAAEASTQLSSTQKFLQSTSAAVVSGVNQTTQAMSANVSATAALTVESVKAANAQASMSAQARFFSASTAMASQATAAVATATSASVLEMNKATQARQAMTGAERFFADSSRATASIITQAALPATTAWNNAVQQSTTVTVTAARAKEAMAAANNKTQASLLASTSSTNAATASLGKLKDTVGMLSFGFYGLAAAVGVTIFDSFLTKAKDINEQIRETIKLLAEFRAKETEQNQQNTTEATDPSMTPEQRLAALKAERDRQQEALASQQERYKATQDSARAARERRARYFGFNDENLESWAQWMPTVLGGAGASADQFEEAVLQELHAAQEQRAAELKRLDAEIQKAEEAAKNPAKPGEVPPSAPPAGAQPPLPFNPNEKQDQKAAAETEKDIISARKQFEQMMERLFQQGLPEPVVSEFKKRFEALAAALHNGTMSTEQFEKAVEALSTTADRTAQSTADLSDFAERMKKAVDEGLPQVVADQLSQSMAQLAAQFQNGQITEAQYEAGRSQIQDRANLVGRLADQRRDFTLKANENVADGKLTQEQANGYIESLKALQAQLAAGKMTTFEYQTELAKLNNLMTNQAQKNAAITNSNQKLSDVLQSLTEMGLQPAENDIATIRNAFKRLQNDLREGRISVDEFNHAIGKLGDQISREAEAAQRAALLRGDFANAGNEFNIQRAIEDRLLNMRRQQFGDAVDNIVQRMTGFGNAVSSVAGAINDARQTIRTGVNSTVTFINEQLNNPIVWDRIQVLTQQIQILSNSMRQAPTYTIQKRLADQIEALNAQLSAAYEQAVPMFSAPQGNSLFEDPGNVTINNNLSMPNVTNLTQAQIYDLADKISREQQRRGVFR